MIALVALLAACGAPTDNLGALLEDIQVVERSSRRTPANNRYSNLEKQVLDVIASMDNPCGAALLEASADSPPGFTIGREGAYQAALEVYERYGYVFLDEDPASDQLDRDAGIGRSNRRRRWKVDEIRKIEALLISMGETAHNLPLHAFIRDDVYRYRKKSASTVLGEPDTLASYWIGEVRVFDEIAGTSTGCFLQTMLHELVHAYLKKPSIEPKLQQLYTDMGWTENGTKPYDELYYDCVGAVDTHDVDVAWLAPSHYTDGIYHQTHPEEDVAERVSFALLQDDVLEDCPELDHERPAADARIEALLQRVLASASR